MGPGEKSLKEKKSQRKKSYTPPLGIEPRTCRLTADRSANGALEAVQAKHRHTLKNKFTHAQKNILLAFLFSWFIFKEGWGTKNSAVYSMRGTLQYRFTTARVQWPCSTDIHWACLITQSGPARYVTNRHLLLDIEWAKMEIKLRVRRGF